MARVISYLARLDAPLIIAAPGGSANAVDTLRFVTGAAIRGVLAARHIAAYHPGDPADDDLFRRLFLSQETRFLNLYPVDENKRRMMPRPLSLKMEKAGEGPVYDLSVSDPGSVLSRDSDSDPSPQLRDLPGDFASFDGPEISVLSPSVSTKFHHARSRRLGRATEKEGEIFTYTSIDKDQWFEGHVLLDCDADADVVCTYLEGTLNLGKSLRTEYGGRLDVTGVRVKDPKDLWREIPETSQEGESAEFNKRNLVVTLLSDYLDEGPSGQATVEGFREALIRLGIHGISEARAYIKHRIWGGYLTVWHLPRPQALSLAAGSVLVFRVEDPPDPSLLAKVEWEGIGGRRNEGFGRVCFNRHGRTSGFEHCNEAKRYREPEVVVPGSCETLRFLQERLLREALDKSILSRVRLMKLESAGLKSRSIIGRLRTVVRDAQFRSKPETITAFLQKCEKKPAEDNLKKITVQGVELPEWVKQVMTIHSRGEATVWSQLDAGNLCQKNFLVSPEDAISRLSRPELIGEYQCKLLDAVLSVIHDTTKEGRDGEEQI